LALLKIKLSYYEFLFLNFLHITKQRKIDILILEVGLGGRFDTVNLIEPTLTAITSISRDHEEILGRGFKNILFEKLGISRTNKITIYALELLYCRDFARQYLKDLNAFPVDLFESGKVNKRMAYKERNRVLALELFYSLNLTLSLKQKESIKHLIVPDSKGRFEKKVIGGVEYSFCSAHNLDGIRKMMEEVLARSSTYDSVLFSFSDRKKEELIQFVNLMKIFKLSGKIKKMFIVSFSHLRAPSTEKIRSLEMDEIKFCNLNEVTKKTVGDKTLFVTGSYYFLGEVQKQLTKEYGALF
jgi:dihydrofolate synthase/folylpolyglutamate synthase